MIYSYLWTIIYYFQPTGLRRSHNNLLCNCVWLAESGMSRTMSFVV